MLLTLYLKQISKCTKQIATVRQSDRTAGVSGFHSVLGKTQAGQTWVLLMLGLRS